MAALYSTGVCLYLISLLGANAEADPILDRLARLKSNFAHMHHRHQDASPPQDDAPTPQMSFSQGPVQAPHLDLSVLGAPPQGPPPEPMMDGPQGMPPQSMMDESQGPPPQPMDDMQRPQGPPLSMGQMNAPQQSFEAPQSNFAQQDDQENAPRMEEGRRDDEDGDDAGSARESQAAKSDPIVQKLALLKSNFRRMHTSHRSEQTTDARNMEQNEQMQNFRSNQANEGGNNAGDFQREQSYQQNPAPVAPVDAAPTVLDMSTVSYGSPKPLAARQAVFGLKMPDVDPPQEEDDSPAGPAPQANFQQLQGQADDNQQGPVDDEPPQPQPQRSGSFDRQNDPIIARLSRFRDNIEQMKSSKSLTGGRGRPQPEALPQESSDEEVAQQNGMSAFTNYQPDQQESSSDADSQAPPENFPPPAAENARFQGFQSRTPGSRGKPSMSAAEVIAKLQMEGNAQLQAEFHPQSAMGGGFVPNILPGVHPDPDAAPQRSDSMEGEDQDRQEVPPQRTRKRMNLWAQSQQQEQGSPMQRMPQQFFQQRDQMPQGSEYSEQAPGQEAPMQRQWAPEGQPAFNQVEDQSPQGQPDSDQDRPVDNGEDRPAASRQRDDPIVDRLGMLQNNFKRMRNHAHIQNRQPGSFVQNSEFSNEGDSDAQQYQGDGQAPPSPDENQADSDSGPDQNSMPPQGSPSSEADQDQDAMPPRSASAPHRWSLLQSQSNAGQSDIAQSSHASLVQFTKAQAAVDPEVAATDKSIDAQVAEAESVGPSSAITDLINKHTHQDVDDKLAMIQQNFADMRMRRT
jgi:hypothetical protein